MDATSVAIELIVAVTVLLSGMFWVVRSFGYYTGRIEQSNQRTRQSCEESAQRVWRTEARITEDESAMIELVREMMKSHVERSA